MKKLLAPVQMLIDFAESFAYCPCCQETRVCVEGCTYRDDCEEQWEIMERARLALREYEKKASK